MRERLDAGSLGRRRLAKDPKCALNNIRNLVKVLKIMEKLEENN